MNIKLNRTETTDGLIMIAYREYKVTKETKDQFVVLCEGDQEKTIDKLIEHDVVSDYGFIRLKNHEEIRVAPVRWEVGGYSAKSICNASVEGFIRIQYDGNHDDLLSFISSDQLNSFEL
jgi:hypothetical protein